MFQNVKADIRRYIVAENVQSLGELVDLFLFNYALWVILSYRFGRWVRYDLHIPVIKQFLKFITRFLHELLTLLTGVYISFDASIGPGLYVGHYFHMGISGKAVLGSGCTVGIGVIIGQGGRGEHKGHPAVGNNVYFGVGAKVFGKVRVGDYSAIGANAVVTKDVPSNITVAGVPAHCINNLGSRDFMGEVDGQGDKITSPSPQFLTSTVSPIDEKPEDEIDETSDTARLAARRFIEI
jgi:serine O-acetyltransferase